MARRSLVVACVALCVSAAGAFAPLPLAPATRTGLRAAICSAEPSVSRRDALGRALSLLGGAAAAGGLPKIADAKLTKATAEDTVAAWNRLVDAKDLLEDVSMLFVWRVLKTMGVCGRWVPPTFGYLFLSPLFLPDSGLLPSATGRPACDC